MDRGGKWSVRTLDGAVLATGFDLDQLVAATISNSLIQAGARPGEDGVFSATEAGKDFEEHSVMGQIGMLSATTITDSVVAAGGLFNQLKVSSSMVGSSVSSGLNLGSAAIRAVIDDATPLLDAAERNAARSGHDRMLRPGDFNTVKGGVFSTSALSAGVDAGPDGEFGTGDDSVLFQNASRDLPDSGGRSRFGSVKVSADIASAIVSDSGIDRNSITGSPFTDFDLSYALTELATDLGNPLEVLVGAALPGEMMTLEGIALELESNVVGATVDIHDDTLGDGKIDSIVVRGTDRLSRLVITGGGQIGRVLTEDDAVLDRFSYDGAIDGDRAGDGAAIPGTPDLFFDATASDYLFDSITDDTTLYFGGDVDLLDIGTFGHAIVTVAGGIKELNIVEGTGNNGLLTDLAPMPFGEITQIATDSAGNTWLFNATGSTLSQIDPATGAVLAGPTAVTDGFTGDLITLEVMDFDHDGDDPGIGADDNLLLAVAEVLNPNPTLLVGSLADAGGPARNLRGMAISPTGRVMAIENVGFDQLVEINADMGMVTVIGALRDIFNNSYGQGGTHEALQLAFNDDGVLLAIVSDADGSGSVAAGGAALVMIETDDANANGVVTASSPISSFLPGVLLDEGGAVFEDFAAMAVDGSGEAFAIRRVGVTDQLVHIALDGTLTSIGTINVTGADTNIIGMGFDAAGNLLAFDNDAVAAQLIVVDTTDPTSLSRGMGEPGLLDTEVSAFALARDGDFATFAYDNDSVPQGRFFTNPGVDQVLGSVDPATGVFVRRMGLTEAAGGVPLAAAVTAMSVDNTVSGNVFISTEDGVLFEYDPVTGDLVGTVGSFTDVQTGAMTPMVDIDFDDAAGVLRGVDDTFNRLVVIDQATAAVTATTEPGSVRSSVSRLAFDLAAGTFLGIDSESGALVSFNGTSQDVLQVGLFANSIDEMNVTGLGEYSSRVTTLTNSFGDISISGAYAGSINTSSTIDSFDLVGEFAGSILADEKIVRVHIVGDFSADGFLVSEDLIGLLMHEAGDLAGTVQAEFAGNWLFDSAATETAVVRVNQDAQTISFSGDFDGTMDINEVGRQVAVSGTLGETAQIMIHGEASSMTLSGGTNTGSEVIVGGYAGKVTVGGTHSGQIAVQLGLKQATLTDVMAGLLVLGGDSKKLTVRGDSQGAVYSVGSLLGPDGIYNTSDDILLGGSLDRAMFQGMFSDSVLAVGVLPTLGASSSNGNNIPDDLRSYTGNSTADDIAMIDSAESGGLFASVLGRLTMKDQIFSTSPATGRLSAVVTAGGVGKQSSSAFNTSLSVQEYDDPDAAPVSLGPLVFNSNEIRITFSEPVNTASVALAIDANNDGDFSDEFDTPGAVQLRDSDGNVIDDAAVLSYFIQTTAAGDQQGVLRIILDDGLADQVTATLVGATVNDEGMPLSSMDLATTPSIYDRSSLRSALRDIDQDGLEELEDPFGTIFDGNGDGVEGGDSTLIFLDESVDTFTQALAEPATDLPLDSGVVTFTSTIANASDVDVYRINADAFQFLSVEVDSAMTLQMAVFVHDDQGTDEDADDDTFEMLTRWEINESVSEMQSDLGGILDEDLFMAFELPPVEDANEAGGLATDTIDYFVAVMGSEFETGSYEMTLQLASTDTGLGTIPENEVIAYISNAIGENNNLLGANEPNQLVYLNFDGGVSREVDPGAVVDAFDSSAISPLLEGLEDLMIFGGIGSDGNAVVGIVDLIVQVLETSSPMHPLGQLNVEILEGDLSSFLALGAEGLFFTTVDPVLSGLDPEEDFTTLLFGQSGPVSGVFGQAGNIDLANMSKADEAIIFVQTFSVLNFAISDQSSTDTLAREFAEAIAGTAAHELGHTLGLNHTLRDTIADDPNNDGDPSDSVAVGQLNLIASGPGSIFPDDFLGLPVLGTSGISTLEFASIGGFFEQQASVDVLNNLLFWLS